MGDRKKISGKIAIRVILIMVLFIIVPLIKNVDTSAAEISTKKIKIQSITYKAVYGDYKFSVYEKLLIKAIENNKEKVELTKYKLKTSDIKKAVMHIKFYAPQCFNLSECIVVSEKGKVSYVNITYNCSKNTYKKKLAIWKTAVNNALKSVNPWMTSVEKALIIHNYIINRCEYDYSYKNADAYNFLVKRNGVCQGYAITYGYLLHKLGIPVKMVTSDKMNHMWNLIYIGKKWYHVDATWDDPGDGYVGGVRYDYFMKNSAELKKLEHNNWSKIPTSNSTLYKNAVWTKSATNLRCYLKKWYFISTKNILYRYDFKTNKYEKILQLPSETERFDFNMSIAIDKKIVYFNSQNMLWGCELDGTNMTPLISGSTYGAMQGVRIANNMLYFGFGFSDISELFRTGLANMNKPKVSIKVKGTEVTLKYGKIPDAKYYDIIRYKAGEAEPDRVIKNVKALSYTDKNLIENESYEYVVMAKEKNNGFGRVSLMSNKKTVNIATTDADKAA